jgi:hypothetical protein
MLRVNVSRNKLNFRFGDLRVNEYFVFSDTLFQKKGFEHVICVDTTGFNVQTDNGGFCEDTLVYRIPEENITINVVY